MYASSTQFPTNASIYPTLPTANMKRVYLWDSVVPASQSEN